MKKKVVSVNYPKKKTPYNSQNKQVIDVANKNCSRVLVIVRLSR